MTAARPAPGLLELRDPPPGLPDPNLVPPTIAESGDPFAAARIVTLLARIQRARPVRIADIADRLNATYLDWIFSPAVVADVILQLQVNWMADYRNTSGIVAPATKLSDRAEHRTSLALSTNVSASY